MTAEVAEAIAQWGEIESVEPFVVPEDFDTFSRRGSNFSRGFMNHDHMPASTIPYEGHVVQLSAENWHLYQDIVETYQRNSVQRNGDTFIINAEETNRYTIRQDYYFMMGDNRDDSEDSRFWGFVPDDHVKIGRAHV